MRLTFALVLPFIVLALASDAALADDYLTKDGQLTEKLKLLELQGGFTGYTGVQYSVAPDGSWTSESVFNKKITPKDKGKLSKEDLAKLADILKENDLAKLPAKSGKQPGANPRMIELDYGKKKASLIGQTAPQVDPKNPTGTVESRFAGIWEGVTGSLTQAPK